MGEKILASLHPLERAVLPALKKSTVFEDIVKAAKLSEVEVMRALQWLENRKLLQIHTREEEVISTDVHGDDAVKNGLVETRFLKALKKPVKMQDLPKKAGIAPQEVNVCLGLLKAKQAITLEKGVVSITERGTALLKKESPEEKLLKTLPREVSTFSESEKDALEALKKRKQLVKVTIKKIRTITLSPEGKALAGKKITLEVEERLTSEMLKTSSWQGKTFRRYDTTINVPKVAGGRRHFVNDAIQYIKQIWLDLGFEEMEGNMVQTSFWNLDALFVPQDHPARAMQDTFYLKNPKSGKLPKKKAEDVKAMHEQGGTIGSKGWGGVWSEDVAAENNLRTHTTVLSAQTLAKIKKGELPKKFFAIGKVFRNETLDWSHLFEFYQVEGIVIDKDANFQHLKWYLQEFYRKMGYSDIRMRPAHFPYTEPSVEVDVYDPKRKEWIELGGAGIFRPEVVVPLLGEDIPVLAWGNGLGRIISRYYDITDIRDLYKNDLKQMREMKAWLL